MKTDGWRSTKLWTALSAMGLIMAGFCLCKDRNAAFWAFVTGQLAAAGVYKVANLAEKLRGSPGEQK